MLDCPDMPPTPRSQTPTVLDARKEAGERTRRRLVEAAQDLIAERGESAIRLRDLTTYAQANVAAVHYHFGSMSALLATAATEAVEQIIDAQIHEVESLPDDATLLEIAGAYYRPLIQELSGPSSKGRPYVRVLSRLASDPPDELRDWAEAASLSESVYGTGLQAAHLSLRAVAVAQTPGEATGSLLDPMERSAGRVEVAGPAPRA
jgi:AcrR family transcriptional regulator